jgi:hypothetical protein
MLLTAKEEVYEFNAVFCKHFNEVIVRLDIALFQDSNINTRSKARRGGRSSLKNTEGQRDLCRVDIKQSKQQTRIIAAMTGQSGQNLNNIFAPPFLSYYRVYQGVASRQRASLGQFEDFGRK